MGIWKSVKAVLGNGPVDGTRRALKEFQDNIRYSFNDPGLLREALTHRSYARTGEKEWVPSNERLEFLGDSVLGLVVSEYLFMSRPNELEGGLTKLKALLVNETTLSRQAADLGLGDFLILSLEEEKSGGRERPSILADAFEAVIGAIYLDGGLSAARPFIRRYLLTETDKLIGDDSFRNYKGELLEYLQARGAGMPKYVVVDEDGPDHEKLFTVEVITNGDRIGGGSGPTKKDAEQKAAAQALLRLQAEKQILGST